MAKLLQAHYSATWRETKLNPITSESASRVARDQYMYQYPYKEYIGYL